MRYLFWNTNRKDVNEIIYNMVQEHRPTLLALAEYDKDIRELVKYLKIRTGVDYAVVEKFACRVQILIQDKLSSYVKHCSDHTNYTIKVLPYNSYHDDHIVAFVHLPSKMQDNREKNRHLLEQITCKINNLDSSRNRKAVILGDLNDINGTYYYDKTMDHSRYWNTFDQFVVSPALIKDIEEIRILKNVGSVSLANKNRIPDSKISDHYPLYFKLGGA